MPGYKHKIRSLLWKAGYDVQPYHYMYHPEARLKYFFNHYEITTVIDVGANTGQFAKYLRNDLGYRYTIHSFEPLSSEFAVLENNACNDPRWFVYNYGLGNIDEEKIINRSENSVSSSVLPMLSSHASSDPSSVYCSSEKIRLKTLDGIFAEICSQRRNIFLKIDVQGFEAHVLEGSAQSLETIDTIQLEMSLVPLYEGEKIFHEHCEYMSNSGYSLVSLAPGFVDPRNGHVLQVDGVFHRSR